MADDPIPAGRKHRVIAWQPAAGQPAATPRRLPRWLVVSLAAAGLLLVAFVVLLGFAAVRLQRMQAEAAALDGAGGSGRSELRDSFVGRSRAEYSRETAMRGLEVVRKTPTDHPAVRRRLIEVEKAVLVADKAFGDARYDLAVQQYDALAAETRDFADALEDMRKARETYDRFFVDVTRLDRFKEFEPATFDQALTAAGASRHFADEGSFRLAREKIEEAAQILVSIEQAIDHELQACLADGRAALVQGDGTEAADAFQQALHYQPGNEVAVMGLQRAKTIARVFELLAEADRLERSGALEQAQAAFEQALATDRQSATAQAGVARMKVAIRERDFQAAIDRARAAAGAANWADAILAYEAALKIHADDNDIQTALAEAKVRQREAYIRGLLAEAYKLERAHEWEAARKIYLDLLQFEPDQADAGAGLARAGKVLRALLKFERHIEESRSFAQRGDFQSAIQLFNEAMANKPSYLPLTPEQNDLRTMLDRQSKPVQIVLHSDNRTWVTIQNVRLLGKFEEVSCSLLPGNYEVIGRRKGYEDVREIVRVRAGGTVDPITIVATKRLASN